MNPLSSLPLNLPYSGFGSSGSSANSTSSSQYSLATPAAESRKAGQDVGRLDEVQAMQVMLQAQPDRPSLTGQQARNTYQNVAGFGSETAYGVDGFLSISV